MTGVVAVAIFAAIEKSVIMFVSACVIGAVVYTFRRTRLREKIIAIIVAAVGGGIGAEIVHTVYSYGVAGSADAPGDSGGLFMSAILIGLINAAVCVTLVLLGEAWFRFADRKPRHPE